jgi:hypothetical protein
MFLHLVLDGMWTTTAVFWWPFFGGGWDALGGPAPETSRGPVVLVALEALGLLALGWFVARFGLRQAERRAVFLRTGRITER